MAAVEIESWVGEIGVRLPGCPEPVILAALRRGAQKFAGDTRLWRVSLGSGAVPAAAAQGPRETSVTVPGSTFALPDYSAGLTDTAEIEAARGIKTVILNIAEVRLQNGDGTPAEPPLEDRTSDRDDDRPYAYDQFDERLTFYERELVDSGGTVEVFAVLGPTDAATHLPDALARWKLGMFDWALYELLVMPKREWSDRTLGLHHWREYQRRVGEGTVAKSARGTGRPRRTARLPLV